MLLKEMYQAMYGKIDTRIGRAFAPITEVDDEQMIKYKSKDGESKEMKASSAKTMPMDHPAKVEYDKLAGGDDGGEKKSVNIFDKPEPDGPDDGGEGSDDDWDRDPSLEPGDDGRDYAKPGDEDWDDPVDPSDFAGNKTSDGEDTMDNLKWGDAESTPETDSQAKHWDDESNWSDDNKELRRKIDNSGASYYLKDPTRLQNFKNNPKSAAKLMKDKNWPPEVVQHMKDIGVLPDGGKAGINSPVAKASDPDVQAVSDKFKEDEGPFEDEDQAMQAAANYAVTNWKALTGAEWTTDDQDYELPPSIQDFVASAVDNDDYDPTDLNDALVGAIETNLDTHTGKMRDVSHTNFPGQVDPPKKAKPTTDQDTIDAKAKDQLGVDDEELRKLTNTLDMGSFWADGKRHYSLYTRAQKEIDGEEGWDAAKSIEKLSTVLRGGKGNVALAIKKLTPQAKKMIDAEIEKIKRGEYVVDPEAAERSALFNKDEEAIMPKGSFQEIKEQWVRDNIKVL